MAYLDIDHFKAVNDRLGHQAGDHLLIHVADSLQTAVRMGDVAVRIGGDEFVVVGEAASSDDAHHFGQRIIDALSGHVELEGEQVAVEVSVGVTYVTPGDGANADQVLSRADAHMYEAKRHWYTNQP